MVLLFKLTSYMNQNSLIASYVLYTDFFVHTGRPNIFTNKYHLYHLPHFSYTFSMVPFSLLAFFLSVATRSLGACSLKFLILCGWLSCVLPKCQTE